MSERRRLLSYSYNVQGVQGVMHGVHNDLAGKTFVRGAEALLCT